MSRFTERILANTTALGRLLLTLGSGEGLENFDVTADADALWFEYRGAHFRMDQAGHVEEAVGATRGVTAASRALELLLERFEWPDEAPEATSSAVCDSDAVSACSQ